MPAPDQRREGRVIRVIVRHDEDAGPILAAQDYDPDSDFAIIRRIVAAPKPRSAIGQAGNSDASTS